MAYSARSSVLESSLFGDALLTFVDGASLVCVVCVSKGCLKAGRVVSEHRLKQEYAWLWPSLLRGARPRGLDSAGARVAKGAFAVTSRLGRSPESQITTRASDELARSTDVRKITRRGER